MFKTRLKKSLLNKYTLITLIAVLISASYYYYKHVTSPEYDLVKQVKSVAGSYMDFHYDVRGHLPYNDKFYMDASYLIENKGDKFENWDGSYTDMLSNGVSLVLPGYNNISILYLKSKINLGGKNTLNDTMQCTESDYCKLWFKLDNINADLADVMENYKDKKYSLTEGIVRYIPQTKTLYLGFIKNYQEGTPANEE